MPHPVDRPERPFLAPAPTLDHRTRRFHRVVLGLILLLGLAKGTYWAFETQVWNPIDEIQHVGYVQSIATGHGIPVAGRDLISDEVMAAAKASTTSSYRQEPYQPTHDDGNWGGTRHQYEAIHGPTYYALMVPAYWIGHGLGGLTGALYALRLATVMLALTTVPLTWLLARRLFPGHPAVWLLAPALLVAVSGLDFGSVSNDALLVPLATASIVAFLHALSDDRDHRWAVGAGVLIGATLVTKTTGGVLVPFLALAAIAWVVTRRPGPRRVLAWAGWVALGGVIAMAPWIAYNLATYGAISAAGEVDALTGSYQPHVAFGWAGVQLHVRVVRGGLWSAGLTASPAYQQLWERAVVVALAAGLVASAARRRWSDFAVLAWCGSALVLAMAFMEVLVYGIFGGAGLPVGRHLYAALPPTLVAVAASAVLVLGRRWGPVAITALIAWAMVAETHVADSIIRQAYLRSSIDSPTGRLAPAVSQTWADTAVFVPTISVSSPCPVSAVSIGFPPSPPDEIALRTPAGPVVGHLEPPRTAGIAFADVPLYRLDRPVSGAFTIAVPQGHPVNISTDDRSPEVALPGRTGDPVIRLLCPSDHADEAAFAETYPTLHPDRITLGELRAAPRVLAGLAVVAALVTAALSVFRRRPRSVPRETRAVAVPAGTPPPEPVSRPDPRVGRRASTD